ncbi:cholera enterotoxin subunit A2 [Colletotrichum eremochloae]|nr:cholera enterotoxin subunit A2 [Colletotrichum eremochloae]
MGKRQNLLVFFYLASFWFLSGEAAFLSWPDPKFVYRGAGRPPERIKEAGGFLPKGLTTVGVVTPNISLYNHVDVPEEFDKDGKQIGLGSTPDDDGYVSFTKSFFLALGYAFYSRKRDTTYIYKVKSTPNMIDVAKTLGKYNLYGEEDEFSALGGVKWDQIVSWYKVDRNNLHSFSWLWGIRNEDYNEVRYRGFRTGGAQYSLAGFPPDHEAWDEEPWKQFRPCSEESGTVRILKPS